VVVSTLTSITSPASGISSVKARPSSRMK
jgi:hypothetical protein